MEETKHARGALVSIAGQLARFVIKLIALGVLSRILSDHAIGQMAMILAVVGIASILSDFGLSLAAVQVRELSKWQSNSLFWANIGIGLLFSTVTFFCAPLVADFYNEPELESLTRILAPIFIINGATVQFRVHLNRNLNYAKLALMDVVAPFMGMILAIIAALSGLGAASLVIQEVATAVALLVMCLATSGWMPSGFLKIRHLRPFLTFSMATTGTQAGNYISTNLPVALIGLKEGSAAAGQYSRAYQIFMLPIQQLASPLTRVALPLLARSSLVEFGHRFHQIQLLLGYILATPLTLFAIWAYPLVHLALGPGWDQAAQILEILCIGGCFQAAGYIYYWAYMARSKVGVLFLAELLGRGILIILVIIAARHGTAAVAIAFSIGLFVVWLTTALTSLKALPIDARSTILIFLRSVGIGLLALGTAAAATSLLLGPGRGIQTSAIATAIYLTVYLSSLALPAMRSDFRTLLSIRHLLRSPKSDSFDQENPVPST